MEKKASIGKENEVLCTVISIGNSYVDLEYEYDNREYKIELPKTDVNNHLNKGDKLYVYLSISPIVHIRSLDEMYLYILTKEFRRLQANPCSPELGYVATLDDHRREANIFAVKNTVKEWKKQYA